MSSTVWGHNDLYLDEVQPNVYLILHMINQYEDVTSLVVHLMGARGPLQGTGCQGPPHRQDSTPANPGEVARCPPSRGLNSLGMPGTRPQGKAPAPAVLPLGLSLCGPRDPLTPPHTRPRGPLARTLPHRGATATLLGRGKRDSPLLRHHPEGKTGFSLSPHQPPFPTKTRTPLSVQSTVPWSLQQPLMPLGLCPPPPTAPGRPPMSSAVRDPSTQQDILQTFQSVCDDLGLHEDQTVVLNTDGEPHRSPAPLGPRGLAATRRAEAHSRSLCPSDRCQSFRS